MNGLATQVPPEQDPLAHSQLTRQGLPSAVPPTVAQTFPNPQQFPTQLQLARQGVPTESELGVTQPLGDGAQQPLLQEPFDVQGHPFDKGVIAQD